MATFPCKVPTTREIVGGGKEANVIAVALGVESTIVHTKKDRNSRNTRIATPKLVSSAGVPSILYREKECTLSRRRVYPAVVTCQSRFR